MRALSPLQQQQRGCFQLALILLVILLLVGAGVGFWLYETGKLPHINFSSGNTPTPAAITVTQVANGEFIGISDGSYAFDTNRSDRDLKIQASARMKNGDSANAQRLWRQALTTDTNDAEALIYLEDQRVLATHQPYVTIIVGTTLTGGTDDIGTGRDSIQGTYVAQKEYNDGFKLKSGVLVRVLIANAGSQASYVNSVAQQVVQAAKTEHNFVGVMGWPFSAYTLNAVNILAAAHIPMLSSTASGDTLTGKPFFYRVAPPNSSQAIAGAHYAEQTLNAKSVVIFADQKNDYSNTLAKDFRQQFETKDGNKVLFTEPYTVKQPQTLPGLLTDALSRNPDLIYFAGYSDDMGVLLTNWPANTSVQILGGDSLYGLAGYPPSARPGFKHLHFTAFAYPDEWENLGYAKPNFFTIYARDFDPQQQHNPNDPYGYVRADNDVILAYDAMTALLQGCNLALDGKNTTLTPTMLAQSLKKITGSQAIQGISGQISFGSDGNPVNKAVVVLYVDDNGFIHLDSVTNRFCLTDCSSL